MKPHLSYSSEKTAITVRDKVVEIKPFQIVVWIGLSDPDISTRDPNIQPIPALLDTGNNHNLALTSKHLVEWAGMHAANLPASKHVREGGEKLMLRRAGLWLQTAGNPFRLNVDEGIVIFNDDWPRLPILGLRALTNSNLQTFIYGDTKRVVIRTPSRWYWPF